MKIDFVTLVKEKKWTVTCVWLFIRITGSSRKCTCRSDHPLAFGVCVCVRVRVRVRACVRACVRVSVCMKVESGVCNKQGVALLGSALASKDISKCIEEADHLK